MKLEHTSDMVSIARFDGDMHISAYWLAAWRSGSIVRRMNEVALRWARLVQGWVTVFGLVYHLGM